MTLQSQFKNGRTGRGVAYVSDHSGSTHAKFMRLSARALVPLGVLAAWFLVGVVGKSYEDVHAEIGRPFPALVLIAFIVIGMAHARQGAAEIIEDYVHDDALKAKALVVNKWLAIAIAAIWTASLLVIASPK